MVFFVAWRLQFALVIVLLRLAIAEDEQMEDGKTRMGECSRPGHPLMRLIRRQCPAVDDPLCIIDVPFDLVPTHTKYRCSRVRSRSFDSVQVLNASSLLELSKSVDGTSVCMLSNFFADDCPFSAQLAPAFNALPRVFPSLIVAAIDGTQYSKLNSRYGITGTPTIILWHNGLAVARMEDGDLSLSSLQRFVSRYTDLEAKKGVHVIEQDYIGPLSSQMKIEQRDWLLVASWIAIAIAFVYFGANSPSGRALWQLICTNFREANDQ